MDILWSHMLYRLTTFLVAHAPPIIAKVGMIIIIAGICFAAVVTCLLLLWLFLLLFSLFLLFKLLVSS